MANHVFTAVAFVESVRGYLRVLFTVDQVHGETDELVALFDGEPILMVEYTYAVGVSSVVIDGASIVGPEAMAALDMHRDTLGEFLGTSFNTDGTLNREKLVGSSVRVVLPDHVWYRTGL